MEDREARVRDRLRRLWLTALYRAIDRVLTAGFWLAVAFILVGVGVALVGGEDLGNEVDTLDQILPDVASFRSQGLIDLGIIILLLTPGATVVASLAVAISARDRLFIGVCALLVSIIVGSLVVSLL